MEDPDPVAESAEPEKPEKPEKKPRSPTIRLSFKKRDLDLYDRLMEVAPKYGRTLSAGLRRILQAGLLSLERAEEDKSIISVKAPPPDSEPKIAPRPANPTDWEPWDPARDGM